jgi:hypothetical protein
MGNYATIDDVLLVLPPDIGPTDTSRLNLHIEEAEEKVDAKLYLRCTLPISSVTHPQWFQVAKNITSRLAAAEYIADAGQLSDKEFERVRDLRQQASEWFEMLRTPEAPDNEPGAASAYVMQPTDGGGTARDSNAFFKREQVTLGNGAHW